MKTLINNHDESIKGAKSPKNKAISNCQNKDFFLLDGWCQEGKQFTRELLQVTNQIIKKIYFEIGEECFETCLYNHKNYSNQIL